MEMVLETLLAPPRQGSKHDAHIRHGLMRHRPGTRIVLDDHRTQRGRPREAVCCVGEIGVGALDSERVEITADGWQAAEGRGEEDRARSAARVEHHGWSGGW